jgi:hypothetical protein
MVSTQSAVYFGLALHDAVILMVYKLILTQYLFPIESKMLALGEATESIAFAIRLVDLG